MNQILALHELLQSCKQGEFKGNETSTDLTGFLEE